MLRILIVDRDRDTREALARAFEIEGWRTDTAAAMDDALALLEGNAAYDAVLLEVTLPLPSSLAFVREKEDRRSIAAVPVVAMTSDVDVPDALEGVVRVLRKPFSIGFAMAALCHAAAYGVASGPRLSEARRKS